MRKSRRFISGVLFLGAIIVLVRPVRDVVALPFEIVLQPLLVTVGLLPTALIAAFAVGLIAILLVSRSTLNEVEQYTITAVLGIVSIGSWLLFVTGTDPGYQEAIPDLVIPFLLRIPFADSTLLLYFGMYLLLIAGSSLVGGMLLRKLMQQIGG
ncbi:hypothetical protein ACFQJC_08270 [Haloferax namakaokahaiae]|uniref:Uncharacterized protein n=1 Tax=Haloferax namakaokahaiae TaxID=1748331 RepID=A0ABD5ZDZ6_9EURY